MPETKEPKKRGRPRKSDNPTPPPMGSGSRDGGKGVDKKEITANIIRLARTGNKLPRVDTFNAEEIKERFELYLEQCEKNGVVPTMEGVYNWLGIGKTLWSYIINRKDNYIRSDAVVETMMEIKTVMGEIISGASDAGLVNTAVAILKLTNTFGYRDVKQVEHSNDINVQIGMTDVNLLENKYKPEEQVVDTDLVETETEAECQF